MYKTSTLAYKDALKAFRRNVYMHGDKYQAAVVCPRADGRNGTANAFDEARFLTEASSMQLVNANYATRTIEVERGGRISFHTIADDLMRYSMAGREYQQIMMFGDEADYPPNLIDQIRPLIRSSHEGLDDALRLDYVSL